MKYIDHIKSRPTHERRAHAMQLSGALVVAVFLVWITTIGMRFVVAPTADTQDASQLANVVSSQQGNATLMVASTTGY